MFEPQPDDDQPVTFEECEKIFGQGVVVADNGTIYRLVDEVPIHTRGDLRMVYHLTWPKNFWPRLAKHKT